MVHHSQAARVMTMFGCDVSRVGQLHPRSLIVGAVGRGRFGAWLRRTGSRLLYEYLGRHYPQADWTTMNYGYLDPSDTVSIDDAEKLPLALYRRIATSGSRGSVMHAADMLEVGSGRGGGAAYIIRNLRPRRMVALDVSVSASRLAASRYAGASVTFIAGDAENLPFTDECFDIVLNVESAHCYGSVDNFLAQASRILRPGGEVLFAGFASRAGGAFDALLASFGAYQFQIVRLDDITPQVIASLAADEDRKRALIDRHMRGPLRSFARGAYAMHGSAMRRGFETGTQAYVAAVLRKPADEDGRSRTRNDE